MITLYGSHGSPNTARVRWCLEELGTPHAMKWVDLSKGEQKKPEYTAINPNGRVPTLVDDGFTIWESNAIISYLGDAYGQGSLVPADVKGRATVHQWLFWQSNDLGPQVGSPWRMNLLATLGMAPVNEVALAAAIEAAHVVLTLFESMLGGKAFVTGTGFSLADISLAESVYLGTVSGVHLASHPNVARWFASVSSRPAFKKTHP